MSIWLRSPERYLLVSSFRLTYEPNLLSYLVNSLSSLNGSEWARLGMWVFDLGCLFGMLVELLGEPMTGKVVPPDSHLLNHRVLSCHSHQLLTNHRTKVLIMTRSWASKFFGRQISIPTTNHMNHCSLSVIILLPRHLASDLFDPSLPLIFPESAHMSITGVTDRRESG